MEMNPAGRVSPYVRIDPEVSNVSVVVASCPRCTGRMVGIGCDFSDPANPLVSERCEQCGLTCWH